MAVRSGEIDDWTNVDEITTAFKCTGSISDNEADKLLPKAYTLREYDGISNLLGSGIDITIENGIIVITVMEFYRSRINSMLKELNMNDSVIVNYS